MSCGRSAGERSGKRSGSAKRLLTLTGAQELMRVENAESLLESEEARRRLQQVGTSCNRMRPVGSAALLCAFRVWFEAGNLGAESLRSKPR